MTRRTLLVLTVLVFAAAFAAWRLRGSHFQWDAFLHGLRNVSIPMLILAVLANNSNAVFRAARWTIFLKPSGNRTPWWSLIGSQCIGFAGLAALGRVGELIRPYLVSRRTGTSFASQIAVIAVERIFDLGAFGILFACNLFLSPQLHTLPGHEHYHSFGYAIAGAIGFLSLLVIVTRLTGEAFADRVEHIPLGTKLASGIRAFRAGLNVIGSARDFIAVSVLSLLTWSVIALGYVLTLKAFPSPVHNLTIAHALLLMGFSVAGGLVQLPGIGGGPQVMTALALTRLFSIPAELALSAAMVLWIVSTASAIVPGLLFARAEQISLRGVAQASRGSTTLHPVH